MLDSIDALHRLEILPYFSISLAYEANVVGNGTIISGGVGTGVNVTTGSSSPFVGNTIK